MIQDSLWKILGFILAVLLMFVIPTYFTYQRQEAIAFSVVQTETDAFCQKVRELGGVSESDYLNYLGAIHATGLTYEVKIEHLAKAYSEVDGELKAYYIGAYEGELQNAFEIDGYYSVKAGDFFFASVYNTSPTSSRIFRSMLGIGNPKGIDIFVSSGGIVRYGND